MIWTCLLRGLLRVCYGPAPESAPTSQSGLVLVADGIGGLDLCATSLRHLTDQLGSGHWVRPVPWCHGVGRWYRDLTDTANLEQHAERTAEAAEAYVRSRPDAPIFLIGKSGGCGVVLRSLERLPREMVDSVVLLAPAVSPDYDLSAALGAVRSEMVVFWSPLDFVLLGAGTRIFGTIDRVRSPGAGLVGFRVPDHADATQYTKLRQVRWHWRMAQTGYLGGHVGVDSPFFLKRHVLPLLQARGACDSRGPHQAATRPGR